MKIRTKFSIETNQFYLQNDLFGHKLTTKTQKYGMWTYNFFYIQQEQANSTYLNEDLSKGTATLTGYLPPCIVNGGGGRKCLPRCAQCKFSSNSFANVQILHRQTNWTKITLGKYLRPISLH